MFVKVLVNVLECLATKSSDSDIEVIPPRPQDKLPQHDTASKKLNTIISSFLLNFPAFHTLSKTQTNGYIP